MVVGKYNVFKDPDVIATGQLPVLKRAFQGEQSFRMSKCLGRNCGTTAYGTSILKLFIRCTVFLWDDERGCNVRHFLSIKEFTVVRTNRQGQGIHRKPPAGTTTWTQRQKWLVSARRILPSCLKAHRRYPTWVLCNYKIGKVKKTSWY